MQYYVGYSFILIGLFFIFTGALGMARFSNFFSKLHPASLIDSFGAPILLVGLAIIIGDIHSILKIIALIIILFITSTTTSYIISCSKFKDNDDNSNS